MKVKLFGLTIFENEATAPPEGDDAGRQSDTSATFFMGDDAIIAGPWVPINQRTFNGEKTPGELGNPTNLIPDYRSLRIRAHEANFTSDVIKIITGKFFNWVVGSGLKLQAEPNEEVLKLEKITEDLEAFRNNIEAYWPVFAGSTMGDSADMLTLHDIASDAYSAAFLGGDCVAVLRVDDLYNITVQVIDGQHIQSPYLDNDYYTQAKARGNIILHGIEINAQRQHVAYYVLKQTPDNLFGEYERIECRGKESGCVMAWMIYGKKQRIDHVRGIPSITAIIEKVKKLDRYTEATVGSAEERAKLPWFIEHDKNSDGENPVLANIKRNTAGESSYELAKLTSKNISATEGKTVYNLPIGSKFSTINSTSEINYDAFFNAVFIQLCAACDIPPEVALQKYNSNYSASRAAILGWEYIIKIYRKKHGNDFYQKVYNLWLYVHVLKNKVSANGYVKALGEGNRYVVESYSTARFTGANMPHIDLLKEANAIRVMLGDEVTPLMSYEQASEQLNNGEFSENVKKIRTERESIKDLTPAPLPPNPMPTLRGDNIESKPPQNTPAPAKPGKKVKKNAANG
jgi:capsid protein